MRSTSSRRDKNRGVVLGLAFIVIGLVGYFFGVVIKAALSRQREFLADASAVQYTRNPSGIADALRKIGLEGSEVSGAKVAEANHMFIAKSSVSWLEGLYATHPPIEDRLKALGHATKGEAFNKQIGRADDLAAQVGFAARSSQIVDPKSFVAGAGELSSQAQKVAAEFLEAIPADIRRELRDPYGARACMYALLIGHAEVAQVEAVRSFGCRATFGVFNKVYKQIRSLGPESRIPLIDLATPALKRMSEPQTEEFLQSCVQLAMVDGEVDLMEYILVKILHTNLQQSYRPKISKVHMSQAMAQYVVLSAVADYGHDQKERRDIAYAAGAKHLRLRKLERVAWTVTQFDQAIRHLNTAPFHRRRSFLEAIAIVVQADGDVTVAEAEIVRAVADLLGCPHPFQPLQGISAS